LKSFFQGYRLDKRGIHTDISDTPLQVYINIKKTNDLSWLIKGTKKKFKVPFTLIPKLQDTWKNIEYQVIDLLGIGEEYQKHMDITADIIRMKIKLALTKKDVWAHRIKSLEVQLSQLDLKGHDLTYDELIADLDHNIDAWKMDVERFYSAIKLKRKKEKELTAQNTKNNGKKRSK